jgi:hypothetical protein
MGQYNDYGDLEEIIEDDNTKAIEEYTGLSIQDFVSLVNCGRADVNDTFGDSFRIFGIHQELLNTYQVQFGEEFLLKLGFVKHENGEFTFEELPYKVLLEKDKYGFAYKILNQENAVVTEGSGHEDKRHFLNRFYEASGYQVNVSKENQEKVKFLTSLSGMFIHEEIYNELAGEGSSKMDSYFDELQEKFAQYGEAKTNQTDEDEMEVFELIRNPFSYLVKDTLKLTSFFREWPSFSELYEKPLSEGKLKSNISNYYAFYWVMYSCNRFFFPAMNGEQCGNPQASKKLLEASLKIVNREIEEIESWDQEE